jgi:hypothetical protein
MDIISDEKKAFEPPKFLFKYMKIFRRERSMCGQYNRFLNLPTKYQEVAQLICLSRSLCELSAEMNGWKSIP